MTGVRFRTRHGKASAFKVPAAFGFGLPLVIGSMALAAGNGEQAGERIFMRSCIACHGTDGAGTMPGIPDLATEGGPMTKTDAMLIKSILEGIDSGRAPTPMPPKGGDETMSEADARLVLRYIRRRFAPGRPAK